ncbi:EAL domain-containing protein [Kineosporia rhizophila]|uniref:bifunctional diguanylate cyclase/phosphodiesterase n=1 Tax=Kineosporia rhizophila TaxID=84633 RepID=UPI001E4C572E|nr:EAL domain-containing protein [Kineosporia rhizophila]MCE0537563.1 EAL domain-containing protein [Kineosporia rhizophila]
MGNRERGRADAAALPPPGVLPNRDRESAPRRSSVVAVSVGFMLLYALAVVLGRASHLPGSTLAVVWPAAGVGFVWLARWWDQPRLRWTSAALLLTTSVTAQLISGQRPLVGLLFSVAGLVQAVVAGAIHRRLQPAGFRLRQPRDLWALLIAAGVGAGTGALIGGTTSMLLVEGAFGSALLGWFVRHFTGTVVLAALWLRIGDRRVVPAPVSGRVEFVLVMAASLGFFAWLDHLQHVPLTFLMVPWAVWLGLRAPGPLVMPTVALNDLALILLTRQGAGPFTGLAPAWRILDVQLLVLVLTSLTVMLLLHREENHRLNSAVHQSFQEAQAGSRLLRTVFDTTSEGLAVYDDHGAVITRNRAAQELLFHQPGPNREGDPAGAGFLLSAPDGSPWPAHERPLARALRGEHVQNEDVLVRTADQLQGRLLNITANPMPGAGGAVLAMRDVTAERAAAAEVASTRDLFAGVLDAATEQCIVGCDHDGGIMVFNRGAERMLGYSAEEMLGETPERFHDQDEVVARAGELGIEPGYEVFVLAARRGRAETRRWTYITKDGRRLQVLLTVSPLHDSNGECIGTIGVGTDISEQLAARARLESSEKRFRAAFDTAPVGMLIVGLDGAEARRILQVNSTLCTFTGLSKQELLTRDFHDLTHPDDRPQCRLSLNPLVTGEVTEVQLEKRYQHADGSTRWGMLSATVMTADLGERQLLCLIEDVTARKVAEEALRYQALHDALTGLPNRTLLHDRLEHALAGAGRSGARVGVLFCDLDGFKAVNDRAGHSAGDELLRQVAERFTACLRPGDTLARLGGDEFAVVCPDIDGSDGLQAVAERLLHCLRRPVVLTAGTFDVAVSIGTHLADAVPAGPGTDLVEAAEQALAYADTAMYEAKRAGKNRAYAHHDDAEVRARLLPQLRDALNRDEFVLHGQPVLDLISGHPVAVETLVRWQHPTRGTLSPAEFLDVVEDSPLMIGLGRRVLTESCRMAAAWSEALGPGAPAVHVNVSGRQLEAGNLHHDVVAALQRHGLPAGRLVLELTETHMPRLTHSLLQDLQDLRDQGVRIAIDDLGTGYSSLTRLTELPVDVLKIDLAFVAGLGRDRTCEAVVRAVIGLGQALGVTVVAEGVETPQQADLLQRYGCDTVQGYLYSPPRPEPELLQYLQRLRLETDVRQPK